MQNNDYFSRAGNKIFNPWHSLYLKRAQLRETHTYTQTQTRIHHTTAYTHANHETGEHGHKDMGSKEPKASSGISKEISVLGFNETICT